MKVWSKFIIQLFSLNSNYSAKIIAGMIGWIISIAIVCYSAWLGIDMPGTVELFMVLSCALLGLDTLETVLITFFSRYKKHIDDL